MAVYLRGMPAPSIPGMVRTIAETARPLRVVLFDSHTRGDAREESDVDFLVVEDGPFHDERARSSEIVRLWEALAPFRTPTDLLVYSQDEVEAWGETTNHAVARALCEGVVVYERA